MGKVYEGRVRALEGVSFDVLPGESVAIVGASGSGKSSLLNILGCLDTPTEGTYRFKGSDVSELGDDELSEFRNRHIGFVFQSFNLIPQLDVLENVEVPLFYSRIGRQARRRRSAEMIERLGLGPRARHVPARLSGGECQRVAIARALVNTPDVLIADEPVGNLDSKTGGEIMDFIRKLNTESGMTLVLVTHDPATALTLRRRILISDGRMASDTATGAA